MKIPAGEQQAKQQQQPHILKSAYFYYACKVPQKCGHWYYKNVPAFQIRAGREQEVRRSKIYKIIY